VTVESLLPVIEGHVAPGSKIIKDAAPTYKRLDPETYVRNFVDHTEEYVRGQVHTNGLENF
jgi:hypothetical protein